MTKKSNRDNKMLECAGYTSSKHVLRISSAETIAALHQDRHVRMSKPKTRPFGGWRPGAIAPPLVTALPFKYNAPFYIIIIE